MGGIIGFDSEIIFRKAVKGHMAHVNKKSSEYKKFNVYFDDVVELKRKAYNNKIKRTQKAAPLI